MRNIAYPLVAILIACCAHQERKSTPATEVESSATGKLGESQLIVFEKSVWDTEYDCLPIGEEREISGRYVVCPNILMKRHTPESSGCAGEWLYGDAGVKYLLSYAPRKEYAHLSEKHVVAHGRICDPQMQAIMDLHLILTKMEIVD